jgi:hypothetical protein
MQQILQNRRDHTKMDKSKIGNMVDPRTNYKKEKAKRSKEALPNTKGHTTLT